MKTYLAVSFGMVAGVVLGGFAVQGLHAQTKAPIYFIAEIDTQQLDTYMKDYAPLAQAAIKAAGGKIIARQRVHLRTVDADADRLRRLSLFQRQ